MYCILIQIPVLQQLNFLAGICFNPCAFENSASIFIQLQGILGSLGRRCAQAPPIGFNLIAGIGHVVVIHPLHPSSSPPSSPSSSLRAGVRDAGRVRPDRPGEAPRADAVPAAAEAAAPPTFSLAIAAASDVRRGTLHSG